VHATGQVIHIDLAKDWPAETVRNAMNAHLVPEPIVMLDCASAPDDWHAGSRRPSAATATASSTARARRARQGHVWYCTEALDAEAMHAAAQALVGLHDFTTFRDLACQAKSPMKTLDVATCAARATR
jgi:tRNA pseudouridine38-40 synthase